MEQTSQIDWIGVAAFITALSGGIATVIDAIRKARQERKVDDGEKSDKEP